MTERQPETELPHPDPRPIWEEYVPPGVQISIPGAETIESVETRKSKAVAVGKQLSDQHKPETLFDPGSPVPQETAVLDPDEQELREIAQRARRYVRPARRAYRAQYSDTTDNSVRQLRDD